MSTGVLAMPSLLRLLAILAVLCGLIYCGLYALAHFVQPSPRQMSVFISPNKFYQNH